MHNDNGGLRVHLLSYLNNLSVFRRLKPIDCPRDKIPTGPEEITRLQKPPVPPK